MYRRACRSGWRAPSHVSPAATCRVVSMVGRDVRPRVATLLLLLAAAVVIPGDSGQSTSASC
mgnify:CR=1 FL=1